MKVLLSPLNLTANNPKKEIATTNSQNVSFGGYSFIAKKLPHLHCAYCSKELISSEKVNSLAQFLSVCRAEPKCVNALLEKLKTATDNLSPTTKKIMNFLLHSIKDDPKHSPKTVYNRITTGSMPDTTTTYFKAIFSLYNKKYLGKINIVNVFSAFSNSFKSVHDDVGQQLNEVIDFNQFFTLYTRFLQKPTSKTFLNAEFLKINKNEKAIFAPKRFIGNLDDKVRELQKTFIANGGQKPASEWSEVTRNVHDEMLALADMEQDIKPIFLSMAKDKRIFWGMHAGYSPEKALSDVFMEIMPTTDHINPRSKGGVDIAGNYLLACKSCNYSRSDADFVNFVKTTNSKENIMKHITELDNRLPFLKEKEANLLYKYIEAIKETLNEKLNIAPATPNFDAIFNSKQALVK